jgi:hypothetical protein
MNKFSITFEEADNQKLHLEQRNIHGGAIGDVVDLRQGETANVEIDVGAGVQITATLIPDNDGVQPTAAIEA